MPTTITLIPGDGIGPEVTAAAQRVIQAAGVRVDWEVHNAGAAVAEQRGTVLPDEVLESIRRNRIALKGPIGTPIGKGFRSVNVTLGKRSTSTRTSAPSAHSRASSRVSRGRTSSSSAKTRRICTPASSS